MEKRILLAAVLSIGVLLLWSFLFPSPPARKPATPPAVSAAPKARVEPVASVAAAPPSPVAAPAKVSGTAAGATKADPIAAEAEERIPLVNSLSRIELTNRGGAIRSFELVGFRSDGGGPLELVDPMHPLPPLSLDLGDDVRTGWAATTLYRTKKISDQEVEFEAADGAGLRVVRRYKLRPDGAVEVGGVVDGAGSYSIRLGPGSRPLSRMEAENRFTPPGSAIYRQGGKLTKVAALKLKEPTRIEGGIDFAALEDAYFLTALIPGGKDAVRLDVVEVVHPPSADGVPATTAKGREVRLALEPSGASWSARFVFSPKDIERLRAQGVGLEEAINFGWFGFLARAFLVALSWIHGWARNWGVAIILLTIVIRAVLFGLTFKSIIAMKRMQQLGPKVEAIKEKYRKRKGDADSRTKMNQEMMTLYQAEGVNPASGCLPVLFQVPIFIGFYNLLAHAIELRQAPFMLWIQDLSMKDPYYVMPILMGVAWFIQSMVTPSTADPVQKKIFMAMPIVFTFMMINFPAGLTLYWFVSNSLSILQQAIVNRMDPPAPAVAAER
jgi:YidC/Oxa1 family membrane protein insertase